MPDDMQAVWLTVLLAGATTLLLFHYRLSAGMVVGAI